MNNELTLKELVREFFKHLDTIEESDSGRKFHSTSISSCRTMTLLRLEEILPKMKQLAQECEMPPKGWLCTREKGHDGPCAAYPVGGITYE